MADELFVGRRDERSRFAAVLAELAASKAQRRWQRHRRRPSAAEPADAAVSRVVLVHGLGGSGKSKLLGCFREMAEGRLPDPVVRPGQLLTTWLDWEDEQRDQPEAYAPVDGPGLVTVLDAVQAAVLRAAGQERTARAFGDYRQGAARMPEYAARFADVVAQSQHPEPPFTSQDAAVLLKSGLSAGLLAAGHPGGLLGLSPAQLAAAAQAGGHLSTAAARAVTGKDTGEILPAEYDLVTDPARELPRRVGAAVRAVAADRPLVVFLDTGEVIGNRAWTWLRRVMAGSGARVAWVVGARFETEAEAGPDSPVAHFVRDIDDAHLMLMSPTRFDNSMIRAYLAVRPGGQTFTDEHVDAIARFTRGLPLAVSLIATLLGQGQQVEEVCRETDHGYPSSVVSSLARRYLVHAERQQYQADDPRQDDVMKILGLALAYGDVRTDPDLLAALWATADPLAAFADLSRRHDFVLPVSRRLHDDVRDTLRTDLLDPYRRSRAREINQRALSLFDARLARLRDRWPSLDEQLAHSGYISTVLSGLWHTFWTDNQAGLDLLTEMMPVLAAAFPGAANAAAAMTAQFDRTLDRDQRHDLDLLTQARPDELTDDWRGSRPGAGAARRARITLPGLALTPPRLAANAPVIGTPDDREAAVTILLAGIHVENRDDRSAIAALRAAEAQTASTRLRQAIGARADAIARRLVWDRPRGSALSISLGLEAAELGVITRPDFPVTWRAYASALNQAGRYEDALAAYDRSIGLDPSSSAGLGNRALTLRILGRHEDALTACEEALAACDREITIDPNKGAAHLSRGNLLRTFGRNEEALAAYDRAITIDPTSARAHVNRGAVLRALGHGEEALAAYDRAIVIDPDSTTAHVNRGFALHDLNRREEALAACDQAITIDGTDVDAHVARGLILRGLGRREEALAASHQATVLDPDSAGARVAKGAALQALGRNEEALAACDEAITLDPYNASAHLARGTALRAVGRHQDALAACDEAIALVPRNLSAHRVRETALRGLGRYRDSLAAGENALAVCDQAVTLDPGNANAHLAKGAALRAVGRHQDALAACDRASALSPGNSNAHVARAITLLDLGRYDEALAACDRAIRLNPLNLSAHGNRGVTLHAQGRHRDALAAYDEAAALAPLNAAVLEHKGIVLAATGDLDRALAEFDSARRMNPNGAGEGSAWAGAILWHRCEPVQARDHFKLVEGRVGRSAPFHMAELEAIALCGVGQPDRAEQHLRSVIHRRSPGDRLQTEPVYELLSDPPLPGIDRLRRATDG